MLGDVERSKKSVTKLLCNFSLITFFLCLLLQHIVTLSHSDCLDLAHFCLLFGDERRNLLFYRRFGRIICHKNFYGLLFMRFKGVFVW